MKQAINYSTSTHMLPLLRRTPTSLFTSLFSSAPTPFLSSPIPNSFTRLIIMDPSAANSFGPSKRLMALAQQLRLYKPPPPSDDDDDEEHRIEESAGKVVSQVGFAESATPVAQQAADRFRPKRAAVLICLFEGEDGEFRVILTKRSSRLSTHSGEVSLPGGKAEDTDADDAETALREAKEEIGLDPSLVNVVTCLEPFLSKHLLRVIPVIGILSDKKDFKASPNAAEVEAVFDAPLEMFLRDENRRWEEREWMGNKYLIHFFDYGTDDDKYLIWGLTAGILIRAASIVYQTPPAFLEQNPKFKDWLILSRPEVDDGSGARIESHGVPREA
ncbi:Nudix hydrolase 15, mitochondrial [Orobanche hederae]